MYMHASAHAMSNAKFQLIRLTCFVTWPGLLNPNSHGGLCFPGSYSHQQLFLQSWLLWNPLFWKHISKQGFLRTQLSLVRLEQNGTDVSLWPMHSCFIPAGHASPKIHLVVTMEKCRGTLWGGRMSTHPKHSPSAGSLPHTWLGHDTTACSSESNSLCN